MDPELSDEFDPENPESWGDTACPVDNFVLHSVVVVYVEDTVILENSKWESDTMLSTLSGFVAVSGINFAFFFFAAVGKRSRSFKIEASPIDMLNVLVPLFGPCWPVAILDVSDLGEAVVLKQTQNWSLK